MYSAPSSGLAAPTDAPAAVAARRPDAFARLLADSWAMAGAAVVVFFALLAAFAPQLSGITGNDPYTYHLNLLSGSGLPNGAFGGISAAHWLGVEPQTGRDLFAIVAYGARISLLVGVGATVLATLIGTLLGVTAGYTGGLVDTLLSRFTDLTIAFPQLIFMIALVSLVPASFPKQYFMIAVIGVFGWPSVARVVRGQTKVLRNRSFVVAARAVGASPRARPAHRDPAQPRVHDHRHRDHVDSGRDRHRGRAVVPRHRRPAADAVLGPGNLLGDRLGVGRPLVPRRAWSGAVPRDAGAERLRRRPARCSRPPDDAAAPAMRITRFLLTRIAGMIGVLLLVSLATFLIFYLLPADPARAECGKLCLPGELTQVRAFMGLNEPVWRQYLNFLGGIFTGRTYGAGANAIVCAAPCLGYSFQQNTTVLSLVGQTLPVTASIAVGAAVLWLVAGVLAGVVSALRHGRALDRAVMAVAIVGVSAPSYLVGLLAILLFGFKLNILPDSGYVPLQQNPGQWAFHLILPWCVLAFISAAIYARLTRSQMLDALGEDYVRTARAKGLREARVIGRHALRNVMIPVITLFGLDFGSLLGGAVITEKVFSMYGLGALLIGAVESTDLSVISGVTLLAAVFVIVANFLVDVVYKLLDPRVLRARALQHRIEGSRSCESTSRSSDRRFPSPSWQRAWPPAAVPTTPPPPRPAPAPPPPLPRRAGRSPSSTPRRPSRAWTRR